VHAQREAAMKVVAASLIAWVVLEATGALGACRPPPEAGDPLAGLTAAERERFELGREVFQRAFTDSTGLGPLFNAESCLECHEDPVAGGNGDEFETHAAAMRTDGTCDLLERFGGPVFQQHATPALTQALGIVEEPIPPEATTVAIRTAPDVFGFGLLDAIPAHTILAREDPDDRNHDGVSGRANRFFDGSVGRFGRKAFLPFLDAFNAGAVILEMGVTSPSFMVEEPIGNLGLPPGVDLAADPELDGASLDRLNDFVRFLAPPPPKSLGWKGVRGRMLFGSTGCVSCHTPSMRTGRSKVKALDRRMVHAYTDLLLHDMGPERGDICLGLATASEFRTEPLMGLRFAGRFLHDGAAPTIEDAIELHGGEASTSREKFRSLKPHEREALLEFLKSL
jgi:CxxC motif-containing protein (DUF1111 family)